LILFLLKDTTTMTGATRNTDPVRLGIIGTGLAVEKLHWPALKRMTGQFQVTAFSNRGRANAEHFASYSGTPMDAFVADYQDLLRRDDVDAVLISLPIPLNYPVTKDALDAGKHVICEKPTGANATESDAFVKLDGQYPGQTVLIAENWFYRDDLRFTRSLLDDGAIGRVHLASWRNVGQLVPREGEFSSTPWRQDAEYVGGPHLDGGVHFIAQMRLLCGDAKHIAAETQDANSIFAGPSDMTLNINFVSGAFGNLTTAYPEFAVPDEPNDMRLYGTDGVMSLGREGTRIFRPDGSVESWWVEKFDGGYYNEFLNFHEAVTGDAPVIGTIAQSVRNMEWVTQGLVSAERGKVMEMAPGPTTLSENAVPLWRPVEGDDLFDHLDARVTHEVRKAKGV